MEGLSLRVKVVDFDRHIIIVQDSKGGKDRVGDAAAWVGGSLMPSAAAGDRLQNFRCRLTIALHLKPVEA
jgi:hypothetical protein